MEITQPLDPTIVTFEPDKEAMFNQRFMEEKMSMMSERMNNANEALGMKNPVAGRVTARNGSTDDILPFTSDKKYAKFLRGTSGNHIYEMHTPGYWDKQMKEVEVLAKEKVEEEIHNLPNAKDATIEIDNSSGIVLR